jgi:peptide/nickel transport system permease protein
VTAIGLEIGYLLGGSVIVETIFGWPGVGREIVSAIDSKDFYVVQAGVIMLALVFAAVNLMIDLLYAWIDPRIRYRS